MRWKVGLLVFVVAWTLTTHGKYSASGDEPHYLIVTRSLVADRDLDVGNNYADNDGRLFGHDHLTAGPHAIRSRAGALESVHDIGLPVVLVPGYVVAQWLAGRTPEPLLARFRMDRGLFAYSIISLCLVAMTAVGVALLAGSLASFTGSARAAILVTALAVSPPILSHSFLVFPEAVALFVTCVVVYVSLKEDGRHDVARLLGTVALLGALPWVHRKYSLYVPGLLFVVLWYRWRVARALPAGLKAVAVTAFVLPQIAFHAWTWLHWGNLGGPQLLERLPFSLDALRNGAVGLWLDRQSGVLAYAPLYWLLPACWILTWKRTWPFIVPALLLYVPMASYVEWWAGFAPAARYLVPILPLCAVPLAEALRWRAVRVAAVVLFVPQAAIDAIVWQHPRTLWPSDVGNTALESLGAMGRAYERLLPAVRADQVSMHAVWVALAAAAASAGMIALARRSTPAAAAEIKPET